MKTGFWSYSNQGSVIIADENKVRVEGYFHSLSSARRWASTHGFSKIVRVYNMEMTWGGK